MFLIDYGDEPVKIIDEDALLIILGKNYQDPETMLRIAKLNPGRWMRSSPFSWYCYVENSPYRT